MGGEGVWRNGFASQQSIDQPILKRKSHMNIWTKYARLAIAVPLLAIPLFASTASAAAGPATVTGPGLSVTFPGPNTRVGVSVTVPIQVVCTPLPPSFYGSFGNGHLALVQATTSGKAAVGAGDVFWFLNGSQGGGKGGGGPGTVMGLTCDGTTVNSGTITVTPTPSPTPIPARSTTGLPPERLAGRCARTRTSEQAATVPVQRASRSRFRRSRGPGSGRAFTTRPARPACPSPKRGSVGARRSFLLEG